jgi:hypothetical protein
MVKRQQSITVSSSHHEEKSSERRTLKRRHSFPFASVRTSPRALFVTSVVTRKDGGGGEVGRESSGSSSSLPSSELGAGRAGEGSVSVGVEDEVDGRGGGDAKGK